ncbi:sce7725 family protein [Actinomyces sp. MRS3W]|uniref:sce7725 family protein n=1 Tax=Actinomyces sp. MRS3W TaxID=2800796 RepID=UPI0028FD5BB6|nr:sce7725 family protein [Actinomyces sp. MRS3W]MDU0349055.1 sce7725 family protein [Actinomyces sp. MRS3W]
MYMPRLRARQHEVLAVRNCAASFVTSSRVTPVLEPVALPDGVFAKRLRQIADEGLGCDLVLNPSVGKLREHGDWRSLGDYYLESDLLKHHGLAILSNADADHSAMSRWIDDARNAGHQFTLDIVHEPGLSSTLQGATYHGVRWNVAEDLTVPASYGLPLGGLPVVWANDPFPSLSPNREYVGRGESIFSTRVTGYKNAGYVGVSDFLTLGRAFHDRGGPAYTVVIHFTYLSGDAVRLRHFCSDSNETQDDLAGKFFEALNKLISFIDTKSLPTNQGIDAFRDLHRRQHFPGLGKVKEFSIMNHMLVMQDAIV